MDKTTELEALRKQDLKLKRTIRGTNRELDRALRAVAAGRMGRSMRILESRFEDYADLMFELGRVTAEIRQLRMHVHEQEQRGPDMDRSDNDWQERALAEDRLAWLGLEEEQPKSPSLDSQWQEPEHDRR